MTRIPIDDNQPFESETANPGPEDMPVAEGADSNEIMKLRSERDQLF